MPSSLKTTTASFTYDEPSIFLIGSTAYETKGGVTVTATVNMRQIEVDGVTQEHEGLDFVESAPISISCNLIAAAEATLQLLMWADTPVGTTPNLQWQTPPVNRLLASASYISGVQVVRRRRDGNWVGYLIPRAVFTSPPAPSSGTSGDGTFAISIASRVPAAGSNYVSQWELIQTATPPSGISV
jgi:hypothetical protein